MKRPKEQQPRWPQVAFPHVFHDGVVLSSQLYYILLHTKMSSSSSAAETRSHSAMFKRAKQLEHWNESDTNRAATEPRTSLTRARVRGQRQIQGCRRLMAA